MESILGNKPLVSAFTAMVLAQLLKIIFNLFLEGKVVVERATSTGGMPSSHAATVTALATSVAIVHGTASTYFAISFVLAGIVIFDAVGVRRAAGRHAEVLNEWSTILSEIYEHGVKPANLKTLLGHTFPQVIAGTALGIFLGTLMTLYI
ncbi:MAG: divergent PAP2 family protein [Spirochaetia bacterium]|jgi:uncharacterized protein|nr:divergent PAP2 family protein [Spirochaetia bacterium]MCF7941424.1 divergent PAP2 family protein [Spirochaetia bacterium]